MPTQDIRTFTEGCRARVIAVVRARALDDVMERLVQVGSMDVAIEQVKGYGRQKVHLELYEGSGFEGGFLPKVRVEFTVPSESVQAAVDALCDGARTGRIGDGKIFVHTLFDVAEPGSGTSSETDGEVAS
jgi:nitrogen regulatory protein PII